MKKILYPIISISIILLVIICLGKFYNQDNGVLKDKHIPKETESTQVSIMYETESGSGIYQESTDTSFPSEGYKYNETLSKCENGSTLSWNGESASIVFKGNVSDKCYVYFDVESPIIITSYDLSLSCGPMNYIRNVQINKEVTVQKYVLILDSTTYLESQGNAWSCVDSSSCFSPSTTYNYEFYLITQDGKKSESCFGTLTTANEPCG